ncbi:hypothetical protein BHE74_00050767 [Ensete ventricosum]|nr:hypothetical protein BHE74_00050767 [Ensete ventricosum]
MLVHAASFRLLPTLSLVSTKGSKVMTVGHGLGAMLASMKTATRRLSEWSLEGRNPGMESLLEEEVVVLDEGRKTKVEAMGSWGVARRCRAPHRAAPSQRGTPWIRRTRKGWSSGGAEASETGRRPRVGPAPGHFNPDQANGPIDPCRPSLSWARRA